MDPRKHTPRHIIITLPKIEDKERILKAAREKETVTYKGVPVRPSADFSTTDPENINKVKQTTRTGKNSQKWRSHGGLSARRMRAANGAKGTGNKKHKW